MHPTLNLNPSSLFFTSPLFPFRAHVDRFAADEKAFFKAYAAAYQKLTEGGCPFLRAMA